jgi:predicted XRE-type DNA-binding protein
MGVDIVSNYKKLVMNINTLIDVSGYRNDYIAKKLGIPASSFSVKKNRGSFSVDDMEKIMQVIDNEDVEDYLMLQEMRALKDEETISYEDFLKEIA